MNPIKVLIADDSPVAVDIIETILDADPEITVIGRASNGRDAIEKVSALRPDVITIDINMPVMNGLEAIRHIMAYYPTPILVITSTSDANTAFQSLSYGALEVVEKPELESSLQNPASVDLIKKIKLISKVKVVTHLSGKHMPSSAIDTMPSIHSVIGIVASTGGPRALATLLSQLPKNLAAPIMIVQHIAEGFAPGLVDWLSDVSPLAVRLAAHDTIIENGYVYIANTGSHIELSDHYRIRQNDQPAVEGQRPSGNLLLESLARVAGRNAVGVVLTGMGNDGARGIQAVFRAGGKTIAQDETSSLIFGMPKSAIDLGAVHYTLPLTQIAEQIIRLTGLRSNEWAG